MATSAVSEIPLDLTITNRTTAEMVLRSVKLRCPREIRCEARGVLLEGQKAVSEEGWLTWEFTYREVKGNGGIEQLYLIVEPVRLRDSLAWHWLRFRSKPYKFFVRVTWVDDGIERDMHDEGEVEILMPFRSQAIGAIFGILVAGLVALLAVEELRGQLKKVLLGNARQVVLSFVLAIILLGLAAGTNLLDRVFVLKVVDLWGAALCGALAFVSRDRLRGTLLSLVQGILKGVTGGSKAPVPEPEKPPEAAHVTEPPEKP